MHRFEFNVSENGIGKRATRAIYLLAIICKFVPGVEGRARNNSPSVAKRTQQLSCWLRSRASFDSRSCCSKFHLRFLCQVQEPVRVTYASPCTHLLDLNDTNRKIITILNWHDRRFSRSDIDAIAINSSRNR